MSDMDNTYLYNFSSTLHFNIYTVISVSFF